MSKVTTELTVQMLRALQNTMAAKASILCYDSEGREYLLGGVGKAEAIAFLEEHDENPSVSFTLTESNRKRTVAKRDADGNKIVEESSRGNPVVARETVAEKRSELRIILG